LGEHQGIHRYTVGQRKGLGLSGPEPKYVQKLVPEKNQVVVGKAEDGASSVIHLLQPHWVDGVPAPDQSLHVKIRHRHGGAKGKVVVGDHGQIRVELETPTRAITPGQAAVLYDGQRLVGGGWIC
jgi:tRNA-specific 2-thiouridylase